MQLIYLVFNQHGIIYVWQLWLCVLISASVPNAISPHVKGQDTEP